MLLLASFWPLRHAQLLEIYLHLFTNALEGEQYVAMKQAFERERNEREQNFQTLKTSVDQTEESVDGLRQALDSMREDIQKLEATLGKRLDLLDEAVRQARAEQATPEDFEAAVDKAVASAVKEIGKVMALESKDQARLQVTLGDSIEHGFTQVNQNIKNLGHNLTQQLATGLARIENQLKAEVRNLPPSPRTHLCACLFASELTGRETPSIVASFMLVHFFDPAHALAVLLPSLPFLPSIQGREAESPSFRTGSAGLSAAVAGPERPPATPQPALDQAPHSSAAAETPAHTDGRMRSPSEERAEADITALEAQLAELEVANKFEECAVLTERIDLMKKAQTDISGLKAELGKARATRDFKACAEIQKQIDELKVIFLYLLRALITSTFTRICP